MNESMEWNGMEWMTYRVTGSIVHSPQRTPRILVGGAQISLLFLLAAYLLRNGRVAHAFDYAAHDGHVSGHIFGC